MIVLTEQKEHEIDIQLSAHAAAIRDANMELTRTRMEINKLKETTDEHTRKIESFNYYHGSNPDVTLSAIASIAKDTGISITVSFHPFDNHDGDC